MPLLIPTTSSFASTKEIFVYSCLYTFLVWRLLQSVDTHLHHQPVCYVTPTFFTGLTKCDIEEHIDQRVHFHHRKVVKWFAFYLGWPESHRDTIQRGKYDSIVNSCHDWLRKDREQTPHTQYQLRMATWCLSVLSNRSKNLIGFPSVMCLFIPQGLMSVPQPNAK